MKPIASSNLKEMLKLTYAEMKRIQGLKCPADIEMVKDHTKTLKDLDKRTIRIEAGIAVAVALIMLLGGWEYFKDKKQKEQDQIAGTYLENHKK